MFRNNNVHDYICGQELNGFGWNNVGPASQTVAQHYITSALGQWIVSSGVSDAVILKVTSIMQHVRKEGTIT